MAYEAKHTEMTGTGGGRWTTRAAAKHDSSRVRRHNDRGAIEAGLSEYANEQLD